MGVQNRVLGKGKLFFDQFTTGTTTKQGRRYLGNTPEFGLAVSSENLDHFDSDNGVRVKDDSVTLETNRTGTFTTDNISPENIAMFFLGTSGTFTQVATPVLAEAITVMQDRSYQLGAAQRYGMGVRNVTGVVVKDVTDVTTYVLNTDYTLDAVMGTIEIIVGGGIADNDVIHVDYTPAAETRSEILSSSLSIEGELFFQATNPKGELVDYLMAKVQISPNGDYALKGDEWQQIGFSVEVLKLNDTTPAVVGQGRAA